MPHPTATFQCITETEPPCIRLQGRFDLASTSTFRQAYLELMEQAATSALGIDLAEVIFIDSSALGSLLQLRQEASQRQCAITLDNCSEPVERVLRIANFTKLFTLRQTA